MRLCKDLKRLSFRKGLNRCCKTGNTNIGKELQMTPEEQGLPCYYVIEKRDEFGVNDRGIQYGKQRPQCIYRKEENRK